MKGVPHYGQLKDVNTTDIRGAIHLGCQTMQQMFNADDDGMPYMRGRSRPDPELSMSTGYDGHLPGRHLNAEGIGHPAVLVYLVVEHKVARETALPCSHDEVVVGAHSAERAAVEDQRPRSGTVAVDHLDASVQEDVVMVIAVGSAPVVVDADHLASGVLDRQPRDIHAVAPAEVDRVDDVELDRGADGARDLVWLLLSSRLKSFSQTWFRSLFSLAAYSPGSSGPLSVTVDTTLTRR